MRKLLVVALAIASGILPSVTEGQGSTSGSGIVTGRVTDATTKNPVVGAKVSIEGSVRETSTDNDGRYRLDRAPDGKRLLTVRMVGYAKATREITLGVGASTVADISLEPSFNMLNQVVVVGSGTNIELKTVPNAVTIITAQELERRNITSIDQLFRGDIPGLFALNFGAAQAVDSTVMFTRGANTFQAATRGTVSFANALNASQVPGSGITGLGVIPNSFVAATPIKTYLDGIELTNYAYLNQIDPRSIERIEILTGPQAAVIYGSNAINGVMEIFTKRGSAQRYQIGATLLTGAIQNQFSSGLAPVYDTYGDINGTEGRLSYYAEGSWLYMGQWTPSKKAQRTNGAGSVRMQFGPLTGDIAARMGNSKNVSGGYNAQSIDDLILDGSYAPTGLLGLGRPMTTVRSGQTFGATVSYSPFSWWSHTIVAGSDGGDTEAVQNQRGYINVILPGSVIGIGGVLSAGPPVLADTFKAGGYMLSGNDSTFVINRERSTRNSARYVTTAKFPLANMFQTVVTAGVDEWSKTLTSLNTTTSTLVTGSLSGVSLSRFTDRNHGMFAQGQFGWNDQLFLTLAIRAEWSRDIGTDASPDFSPRYGLSYTHDLGMFTAKFRGSYGRTTRPPSFRQASDTFATNSPNLTRFGKYKAQIGNPDLAPEVNKGGELGVDLYAGNLGSLGVTWYNQTVGGLVAAVLADSARSILTNALTACSVGTIVNGLPIQGSTVVSADGYCYIYQYKNVNAGAIRNNGVELTGSTNFGPLSAKGVYSFTKSRSLGISPAYRAAFARDTSNATLVSAAGTGFSFLPERTWALGFGYAHMATSVQLNINGVGSFSRYADDVVKLSGSQVRLDVNKARMDIPNNFVPAADKGYATASLSASHTCTQKLQALLQVDNLTNYYRNDFSALFPTMGRVTKLGVRYKM